MVYALICKGISFADYKQKMPDGTFETVYPNAAIKMRAVTGAQSKTKGKDRSGIEVLRWAVELDMLMKQMVATDDVIGLVWIYHHMLNKSRYDQYLMLKYLLNTHARSMQPHAEDVE